MTSSLITSRARPGIEDRRSLRAEFVQQIAELLALDSVEKQLSHVDRL
jgi:hypothetical protein